MANSAKITKKSFSCGAMEALVALCDTILPSVDVDTKNDRNQLTHQSHDVIQFFQTSASMAGTPDHVAELLQEKVKHPKIYLAKLAISMLSTWVGTFILCGTKSLSPKFPYFQRFSKVSFEKREQIVASWSNSYFSLLRIFFTALKIFTLLMFFTQVNDKNENISWKAIGYCGPDPARKRNPKERQQKDHEDTTTEEELFGPLHKGIISVSQCHKQTSLHKLQTLGFPISTPHIKNTKIGSFRNPSFIIKCDAVVVGSGSGGGVAAGVLAKAGHKVLVLERGSYMARNNLSLLEGQSMDQMYFNHGLLGTEEMDVMILTGSTVGGGSTVNWSASIRTPRHVTKEWSEVHGLKLFDTGNYEHALDVVCGKMCVQSEFEDEGFNNMVLRKGCEKLEYNVENIPRNAPSDHYCGRCCFGCANGSKKGTSETWLVDLVESGNGAILTECEALKVITGKYNKGGRKKAVGVAFVYQTERGREIGIVEAKVTVAACGAICTPAFLKRSGLRNPNIGRNLHLHPVVMAWGYFPENAWPEGEKRSYEGGIMTAMSKVVANFEGSGYGAIIQTPSLHPGMFSALMPWVSGREIKNRMIKFARTAHVFALARDKGSGELLSETNVRYNLGGEDRLSLSQGVERVFRILVAAGAEEIGTHHKEGRVLNVKQASEEEFEKFVKEESLRTLMNSSAPICSAHQMGSCRMGVGPEGSAVDPRGETWEVEGLFVTDTSVFPTALGVNPMVTVQAIAYCTAQSIIEVLGGKKVIEGK